MSVESCDCIEERKDVKDKATKSQLKLSNTSDKSDNQLIPIEPINSSPIKPINPIKPSLPPLKPQKLKQEPKQELIKRPNIILPDLIPLDPQPNTTDQSTQTTNLNTINTQLKQHIKQSINMLSTSFNSFLLKSIQPHRFIEIKEPIPIHSTKPILNVLIIGIHGWFPNKYLLKIMGPVQGTSIRFTEKMKEAVISYFGNEALNIVTVPIESHGIVEERVELVYSELIKNHYMNIKLAHIVLIATHSQGCPVSVLVLDRLLSMNLLNLSHQKIGLLSMAGINHGPFPNLKSSILIQYVEQDAARQLFEFNDPQSLISKMYNKSLQSILQQGVKIVAIGSWYDQVVPLYSSTMHGIDHPSIHRAIFIENSDYVPDFLTQLVAFALKLRNNGKSDHDIIVNLSDFIAGNIYGFGTQGHSTLHEDTITYSLAVQWTMKPNEFIPNKWASDPFEAPVKLNPFILPWLVSELTLGDERHLKEIDELKRMYEDWNPKSTAFKELKYRLEGFKSKL